MTTRLKAMIFAVNVSLAMWTGIVGTTWWMLHSEPAPLTVSLDDVGEARYR